MSNITLEFSGRRSASEAWRASSDGHVTYAPTKDDALSRHKAKLAVQQCMTDALKRCAAASAAAHG